MDSNDSIEVVDNGAEKEEKTAEIKRKMQLTGTVKKIALAGALVDIGQEQPAVLHISHIQKEPINRVEDVLEVGQTVEVWVRRIDSNSGRVELTMIKPLDLDWRDLKKGLVIKGTVTRLESFGAFVEIGAERPGLIHISELTHGYIRTPSEVVKEGEQVEAKVIGVNRRKKRIRLSMKALEVIPEEAPAEPDADEPDDKPVPTAMEIALREAMEKNKESESARPAAPTPAPKPAKQNGELDDILTRTLQSQK